MSEREINYIMEITVYVTYFKWLKLQMFTNTMKKLYITLVVFAKQGMIFENVSAQSTLMFIF